MPGKNDTFTGLLNAMYGKPPNDALGEKRQCDGFTGVNADFECSSSAVWLLPEVNYCSRHIPYQYLPTVIKRRKLWVKKAIEAWAEVLKATPLPDIEYEEDEDES